jgi:hypothetical protein
MKHLVVLTAAILWAVEICQICQTLHESAVSQAIAIYMMNLRRKLSAIATMKAEATLARDALLHLLRPCAEVALAAMDVRVALANPHPATAGLLSEAPYAGVRAVVEKCLA